MMRETNFFFRTSETPTGEVFKLADGLPNYEMRFGIWKIETLWKKIAIFSGASV